MREAAQPGAGTTLGEWLDYDFDVLAICQFCGHSATLTAEKAIRGHGANTPVRSYFGRLRCRFCRMPPGFQISYHRSCRRAGGK